MTPCAICGCPATCVGRYNDAPVAEPACDGCCSHAADDGSCVPIREALSSETIPCAAPCEAAEGES